jgi:hypothetical protein
MGLGHRFDKNTFKFLDGFNYESKDENNIRRRSCDTFPGFATLHG